MKIAILGYGEQGRSAYEHWRGGNEITVCDENDKVSLPEGVGRKLGAGYLQGLDNFDLVVRSPGIHPSDVVAANSPAILDKMTTVTNEFFKLCPTKNIIGVTGTKGKGTASTLIAKMLEADGWRVHLGGNIGIPPFDMLKDGIQADDWVVLELANFQLIDLKYSPAIAVCLMVVPEHLNWHTDHEEYVSAKQQLFARQTDQDIAIYFSENEDSKRVASIGDGQKIPYYAPPGAVVHDDKIMIGGQAVCEVGELKLLGKHNWQNACAAVTAVWQITQNVKAMRPVLASFTGLEHRLELVRELHGVRYYNDSFGTTPETAIVAMEAFSEPEILILGGQGKGIPFNNLAEAVVKYNPKRVITIGETGDEIGRLLKAGGYKNAVSGGSDIVKIIELARKLAAPGDVVLLSTACTSFDMFDNYKQRGEQFKQVVRALA